MSPDGSNASAGLPQIIDEDDLPEDYDYEESAWRFDLADLIPTAVVYGATLLLGLVGNLLIVYTVARFPRMRSISNLFLASLASADLLIVLLCVPVKFGQLFSYTWTLGELGCKLLLYVQHVSMICSVLNLTFLSIERYYAVIHPVRSRYLCTFSQARRVIIFIWLAAFLTALPIIFVQVHVEMGLRRRAYWCMRDEASPRAWRSFEIYMLILVLCIPTLVMGYAYAKICAQLWMVVRERAHLTSGSACTEMLEKAPGKQGFSINGDKRFLGKPSRADEDTVKQVIKMLILVVSLFVLCWAPILILNVLTAFGSVSALNYSYLKPLRTCFHLLSYLNSCVNPLVYGFMSRSFRVSFRDALLGCLRQGGAPQRGTTMRLSRTRTTSLSMGRSATYVT
ncbi:LOW QUALITY PROTEIN: QRFP-like peptide receptor [Dermacentor silvarum]|uniref:LOW QUALITY PROTEIN: QRFP-like peptide receptor n=1 Tax=Dermacentor silvarum TaxID=543639 RepID=UPI00189B5551|nr:LOW QUALITY PROTEIN: QRFP-like peptide receptor [Dermacentor silvarum]